MRSISKLFIGLLATSAIVPAAFAQDAQGQAKNVIVLITDGAGMETWNAASYFEFGALGHQPYDAFDTRVFMSTIPLNMSNEPTMTEEAEVEMNPEELWATDASDAVFEGSLRDYPAFFSGYDFAQNFYTDSAAAGTALATGQKTYNNAINWSNMNESLTHIGEYAVESGRALGVVSSVQLSHATPASFLAHNVSRNDYAAIGAEIVESGLATVVMGAGHPLFDANGGAVETPDEGAYRYVGGQDVWENLAAGETEYHLIETVEDFEALANGEIEMGDKSKLLGLVQNSATLQYNRPGQAMGNPLDNSPSLVTMTNGALNILAAEENGFFLMIEGGAVDWAAHANNLPRLVEEQIDFNHSVTAVVDWVEENSSWDETLVIVTTDHGNGLLAGFDSDENAYSPILNQGAGALPLVQWHTDSHTRELVPLYAHGAGSDYFLDIAEPSEGLAAYGVEEASQVWVDNTDVFFASMAAMGIEAAE